MDLTPGAIGPAYESVAKAAGRHTVPVGWVLALSKGQQSPEDSQDLSVWLQQGCLLSACQGLVQQGCLLSGPLGSSVWQVQC